MTDKIMEARRAKFEDWHRSKFATNHSTGQPTRDMHSGVYDDEYGPKHQQQMWEAFNAALDSLCVKLPDMMGLGEKFTGTPISEIRAQNHFNSAITQCREAIHAAGVKTK